MDQSLGTTTKWSRNLSEDSQSESNRLRLIERQRQLLESKLQRQHQVIPTSTRPSTARPIKSAISGHRSCERLIDLEDLNAGGVVNAGISTDEPNLSYNEKTKSSEHLHQSPAQRQVLQHQSQYQTQTQPHIQSIQTVSPLSSPEITSINIKTQNNSKSLQINKTDKSLVQKINFNFDKSISNQDLLQLNPLSNILSNDELLLFATQPISPQTTLQCTIIRDKKGLDRSLYPTYYMHLQAIVPNVESDKNDRSSEPSSPKSSLELVNVSNDSSLNSNGSSDTPKTNGSGNRVPQNASNSGGYRQVFLLSGRRRKKSKTYIIGNDPFDISRGNCIAKLKSNVLGTQFTAIRINTSGQRQEIASIIYETNVLGFKGPRRMTALIPKYDQTNNLMNSSIFEEWKRNNKSIIQMKNKTPIWNDGMDWDETRNETQSYVLNFRGRVTQASVKNFQLVTCNEREDIILSSPSNNPNITNPSFAPTIPTTQPLGENTSSDLVSMQFGRVSGSQFSCDVSWPMSLLQAFAIALSSFDSKLACE